MKISINKSNENKIKNNVRTFLMLGGSLLMLAILAIFISFYTKNYLAMDSDFIDSNIKSYFANVSGGVDFVKDDLGQKIKTKSEFISFDPLINLSVRWADMIYSDTNGNSVLDASQKGIQIIQETSVGMVSAFYKNLSGNWNVINTDIKNLKANVSDGVSCFMGDN